MLTNRDKSAMQFARRAADYEVLGDTGLQRLARQLAATVAAIGRHRSG